MDSHILGEPWSSWGSDVGCWVAMARWGLHGLSAAGGDAQHPKAVPQRAHEAGDRQVLGAQNEPAPRTGGTHLLRSGERFRSFLVYRYPGISHRATCNICSVDAAACRRCFCSPGVLPVPRRRRGGPGGVVPLPASEGHRACAGCEAGISLAAIWLGALFLPSLWQILKIKPENVEVLKGCAAPEASFGF